ncbi:MAG TPA: Tat pathway signal sequence domain protein [Candidatus Bathyarchaeia archaeon]|nr:Tat pathway signal sequence domain protein [Candidatus Bathyarchaeia archaeon]
MNILGKKQFVSFLAGITIFGFFTLALPNAGAENSLPQSKMFDLSATASEVIRDAKLHNGTVMQSFAFDNVNEHIYVVQLMAGGQQLPGEEGPVSGANRDKAGDLTLTKLDLSGKELGYMFLKGFGHGVQIGVETVGGNAYIWMETDSVTEGSSGWGTQLSRFRFENEKILTPDSPELEKHRLIKGADRTTVNIDQAHGLLTMRYRKDGEFRFAVFPLEQVKRERYEPIADVKQPSVGTFQGFASYGSYLYLLEGNSFGSNGSTAPTGNTYITAVDLETGEVVDKQLMTAGDDLTFREPEGMAIRIPDRKHPKKAELCFGFASSFTPLRLSNIFALDELIPEPAVNLSE